MASPKGGQAVIFTDDRITTITVTLRNDRNLVADGIYNGRVTAQTAKEDE